MKVIFSSSGNDGFISVFSALKSHSKFTCLPLDMRQDAYSLYLQNQGYVCPKRGQALIEFILKLSKKEKADCIYPLSTDDQLFFARYQRLFADSGLEVIVSPLKAVKTASNKIELRKYASAKQIPAPPYVIVTNKRELNNGLRKLGADQRPVVLKRPYSTGAQGVKVIFPKMKIEQRIFDRDNIHIPLKDLLRWVDKLSKFPRCLLEEYIDGDEYSVDLILEKGQTKMGVVRKRIKTHYGLSVVAEVVSKDRVLALARQTAELLQLDYIVNVQVKEDKKGDLFLLEVNPRIPGSIGLTIKAGCNMPLWVLQRVAGEKVSYRQPQIGTKMIRYYGDVVFQAWKK